MAVEIDKFGVAQLVAALSPNEWSAKLLFEQEKAGSSSSALDDVIAVLVAPDQASSVAVGQYWIIDAQGGAWGLVSQIPLGFSICNVDLLGEVALILDLTHVSQQQPQLVPRAATKNETYIAGHGEEQYFPYAATPAGIYTCSVCSWAIVEATQLLPIVLVAVQYASPFVPQEAETFPLPNSVIELVAMQFYFDPQSAASAAIAMYKPIFPEYPLREGVSLAFPIARLRPAEQILCCFKTSEQALTQRVTRIRATIQSGGSAHLITSSRIGFLPNPNADTYYSTFASTTGFIPFELAADELLRASRHLIGWDLLPLGKNTEEGARLVDFDDKAVGEYDSTWHWQYCLNEAEGDREDWIDIQSTKVETYLTLDVPGFPWNLRQDHHQYPTVYSAPLVTMVILACRMAAGSRNEAEAVKQIAAAIITSGRFVYNYGVKAFVTPGLDQATNLPNGCVKVDLARLMESAQGMLGKAIAADCTDLSHVLMLIANSIGCNAKVGMLSNPTSPGSGFTTAESISLGAKYPVSGQSYTYHEVVYLGECFEQGAMVYDVCFMLKSTSDTFIPALGLRYEEYVGLLVNDPSSVVGTTFTPHEHILFRA